MGQQRTNLSRVQDHRVPQLGQSTTKITCGVVRARFRLITEERDCAWILAIFFLASKGQNY